MSGISQPRQFILVAQQMYSDSPHQELGRCLHYGEQQTRGKLEVGCLKQLYLVRSLTLPAQSRRTDCSSMAPGCQIGNTFCHSTTALRIQFMIFHSSISRKEASLFRRETISLSKQKMKHGYDIFASLFGYSGSSTPFIAFGMNRQRFSRRGKMVDCHFISSGDTGCSMVRVGLPASRVQTLRRG